ncbi:hypothetical protein BST81_14005 [Leptolyngbya sp. 'hensonii']|uniref:DUF1611 domain-containing protein n=1 Tax=Leptolyngbya sp. 'hensonii' TaxID=1922337 RepID=UPI0009500BC9|nr:DUF1611 domain-containing protein [Leptolyngbya sp. 'hensonii']OLP18128.1 hypothetical protein BST81_14005 [Leptolyngbya sp. 'hensonii']
MRNPSEIIRNPETRMAILLHDGVRGVQGKTGLSLLRYSPTTIVAVIDADTAGASLPELTGIPRQVPIVASVVEALAFQPQVLAIGIAPSGGALPAVWMHEIERAIDAGLSIVNGLHTPMLPTFQKELRQGQWIWDVRQEPTGLTVGSGRARQLTCRRVLAVGTDMSIGKMTTGLELHRASLRQGLRSRFIGTGQTALMLGEVGVPLDAVRVDFASGAVEEWLMRVGPGQDIVHVEGQGSLLNPASTATLPLLRGAQPTHLILAHRFGQTHIRTFPDVAIPPLPEVIHLYQTVAAAGGAFTPAKVAAIALNTAHLDETAARAAIDQTQAETGLPCTDPIRYGVELLLDAILANP